MCYLRISKTINRPVIFELMASILRIMPKEFEVVYLIIPQVLLQIN